MRVLQFTLGALAACGVGLGYAWFRGGQLPAEHQVRLAVEFNAPIERVWALLSDFKDQPRWREGLTGVNQAEPGLWAEDYGGRILALETTRFEPPHLLERRIADAEHPFQGLWRFELDAEEQRTRLVLTEEASIENRLYRFLAHGLGDYEQTLRAYVSDLEGELGPARELETP